MFLRNINVEKINLIKYVYDNQNFSMKKIIAVLFLLLFSDSYSFTSDSEGKFLNFSDIHFNPYYDSTLVIRLVNSDFNQWEDIFESSAIKTVSGFGFDCNYPLLKSSLTEMRNTIANPDFIIITGDFMAHNFNEQFEHFTGNSNTEDLNVFISKTIKFITAYITKHYPGELIFPTVGNDDAFCGNYMIEPGGDFLKMLGETWEPWVNSDNINENFKGDFSHGGYCILDFPGTDKYKMIILNTVFFSYKYENKCGDTALNPGKDELVWLEENLERCRRRNQKVYLSYHIPPGADIYGTIHNKADCENKFFKSWKDEYAEVFTKLIAEYSSEIVAGFAGHFHRDDFRIFYKDGNPASYLLITPSISPVYDNNPSYKIFQYDKIDYTLKNYSSYFLNDTSNTFSSLWKFQYEYSKAYDQSNISAENLDIVYDLIKSDSLIRNNYIKYYTASNPKSFESDLSNWQYNYCGIRNYSLSGYSGCLCRGIQE